MVLFREQSLTVGTGGKMALSDRIKLRREERGLTATELSKVAEISKGYLSEIESGQAPRPSGAVLYKLAQALGTTVADLLEQRVILTSHAIPKELGEFAVDAGIPEGDLEMLAQIKFRGEQPRTKEDWQFLYESIKRSISKGN
jgi:transcriptional regulator with XRE-family HTH domain